MRLAAPTLLALLAACTTTATSALPDAGSSADVGTDLVVDAGPDVVSTTDRPTVDVVSTTDRLTVDVVTLVDAPPSPTDAPDVPAVPDVPAAPDVAVDRPAPDAPAADAPPDVACPDRQVRCGGACVDLSTNASHCGSCGSACPAGVACTAGSCLACGGCATGRSCCGTTCVDTQTDSEHCGGCGVRCCAGHFCSAGRCVVSCGPPRVACPGPTVGCNICVDPTVDPAHCGSCGRACASGETCVAGECRASSFMALAPCASPSAYVSGSTVAFGGSAGFAYSPRCLTVRAGTTVAWEGSFDGHPLRPSTRGTSGNPVPATSTGSRATARFDRAGFYPFYCGFHGDDAGGGMAGVVQVTE